MKYLVVILIIVLFFLILKNDISEKFNQELVSPEVIEIIKNGNEAVIKFKTDNSNKKKGLYDILYRYCKSNLEYGLKKVSCDTELCEFTLKDLEGSRYHLVVVETDGNNMSKLGKIIKFGDGDPYTPYQIIPAVSRNILEDNNDRNMVESCCR